MTPYFIGGATGSAVSAVVYETKGWTGVCIVGGAFIAIALVAWGVESVGKLRRTT
jgi:predicted MFS family arabinose efflux permease